MIFQILVMILPRFSTLKDHNLVPRQKLKNLRQFFLAMNMMKKCAKFHNDSPSGKKLNSISRERLNFRRRPFLCTTLYRNLTQLRWHIWPTFPWIFYEIFTEDASLLVLYCKRVKDDQKRKGGPALIHALAMTSQTSKIYTFMGPQWMVRKLSCTEWAALLQKAQSLRFKNTPVTHRNSGQDVPGS